MAKDWERISAAIQAIAAEEAVAKRLGAAGQIVRGSTPAEFGDAIERQRAGLAALVQTRRQAHAMNAIGVKA